MTTWLVSLVVAKAKELDRSSQVGGTVLALVKDC